MTHRRDQPGPSTQQDNNSNKPSPVVLGHINNDSKQVVTFVLNGERPLTCSKCCKTFTDDSSLHTHTLNGSCELIFKCTECDKEYPNEFSFSKHKRVHYFARPYVCKKCPQRFKSSADFKLHICDVPLDDCSLLSPTSEEVKPSYMAPTVPSSKAVEKNLKAKVRYIENII